MPTQEGAPREQGFRSSLFGFDKNDVLAYMNSLVEENQRQANASQEQIRQLQAEVERLTGEQSTGQQSADQLRQELEDASRRADEAEINLAAIKEASQNHSSHYRALQDELNHARLRCRDLEKENERLQKELAEARQAAPAGDPADVIAASAQPLTDARREALRILADARLYAESAEKRLAQEADDQKQRMAAHAADIAAGMLLLRRRLARVDEKLGSATLDLENATAAVYEALDQADQDLNALNAHMQEFAAGHPESDPLPEPPAPVPRARATAQPVAPRPKGSPRPPRRPGRLRRTVSRELRDAMANFEDTQ